MNLARPVRAEAEPQVRRERAEPWERVAEPLAVVAQEAGAPRDPEPEARRDPEVGAPRDPVAGAEPVARQRLVEHREAAETALVERRVWAATPGT